MSFTYKDNIIFAEKENWKIKNGGIGKALFDCMKMYFPRTAQIDARNGNKDTYETLLRKCVRLSIYLQELGFTRKDNLCLCSDNNLDACIPLVASQFIGVKFFATEPGQTAQDTATTFKQIPPKVVFTTQKLFEKITEATIVAKVSPKIIIFEDEAFREILENKAVGEESFATVYIENLNETSVFHCTSGSTGVPKVVQQSHFFKFVVGPDSNAGGIHNDKHEVLYFVSNWFWSVATYAFFMSIMQGYCRILPQTFSAIDLLDYIQRYKVSYMIIVPLILNDFITHADMVAKTDTSSLKTIRTLGSAVHSGAIEKLREVLPHVAIFSGFGTTELGVITFFDIGKENHKKLLTAKPTSVGLPLEGVSYKVLNPDTEEALGPNQPGEIRVKTKKLCNYMNSDITESLDADGFYKTGDVGYYDEDFCFFIVNRLKDEFKYRNWHVSPGYLENVILDHPAVDQVVVVGKPSLLDGSLPIALIVLNEDSGEITSEEIEAFVEERVDDRLRLRGGVRFFKSFPRTLTGKVDRMALRNIFE